MSSFSDNFNRADTTGGLGAPWVEGAVWGISSNQAYDFVAAGAFNVARYEANSADVEISVTLNAINGARQTSLCGRYVDSANFWYVYCYSDASLVRLYRNEAASPTIDGSFNGAVANGDVFKLRMSGNSIKVYQNAVEIISITSTFNNTATKHGIATDGISNAVRWDDFVLTDLNVAAGPPPGVPLRLLGTQPARSRELGLLKV